MGGHSEGGLETNNLELGLLCGGRLIVEFSAGRGMIRPFPPEPQKTSEDMSVYTDLLQPYPSLILCFEYGYLIIILNNCLCFAVIRCVSYFLYQVITRLGFLKINVSM